MSEYQYYEFRAIDRPLDEDEQDELRALSTPGRDHVDEFHQHVPLWRFSGRSRRS